MANLDTLLNLQEVDTSLDQLRHKRATLPERGELESARAAVVTTEKSVQATFAELHEVQSAQKAREDEAATVADKVVGVDRTLYGGTVKAAKELEAYQADLKMLKERQSSLEDEALEFMEQAEPLDAELVRRRNEAEAAVAEVSSLEDRLVVAEAEIDAEIDRVEASRAGYADALPSDVVEQYTSLRAALGGTGAAKLMGARCGGCHLEIPSAELEAVRRAPEDAVVSCPECGRILVR